LTHQAIPVFFRFFVPLALLALLLSSYSPVPTVVQKLSTSQPIESTVVPQVTPTHIVTELHPAPLRILVPTWQGAPEMSPHEKELLSQYAASENRSQIWLPVKDPTLLAQKLAVGEADMVATLRNKLDGIDEGILLYTLPWATTKPQIIGRSGNNTVHQLTDLMGRQIAIRKSSPAWTLLSNQANPSLGLELLTIADNVDNATVLERVKSGQYDLAVVESLMVPSDLEFGYDLEVLMSLSSDTYMNWATPGTDQVLHKSLNQFLNKKHLELDAARNYRDDFAAIKQRKLLRLITYRSPVNYFHDRGRLKGFEYEMMKRFADQHKLRLDVVIAESHQQMQQLLEEGEGDVIAASMPESMEMQLSETGFSRPYNYSTPTLVGREGETIKDIQDLNGRTVYLTATSPYLANMQEIRKQGIDLNIVVEEPGISTETILFRISQGVYDLSVISSHELKAEFSRQLNLQAHFSVRKPQGLVWQVRKSAPELLSELNSFIDAEYKKGFYNTIYARYIQNPNIKGLDTNLFAQIDQISPYDSIVHKYADHYSFDWRLIVALMYQESRFNPRAISASGAKGLMQVLPVTAQTIGIINLNDPDNSIYAGVRYLDQLRSQFENDLTLTDRLWFALAAYNSGYQRVQRARMLAEKMNLDKNRWFNNVELAMQKLGRPYKKDGESVRDCRCGQTVAYVREIQTLYNNYLRLTRSIKAAAQTTLAEDKI